MRSIDQSVGTIRPALMILLAGIAFVLVMASVNVANLLLARSIAREKELATRAALGAARSRIARQLLTESVLFAMAGGLVGMVVMWWTVRGLIALAPAGIPRINEVSIDWRVLLAAGVTTMATGILVGMLPALSSASVNPQASLQDASRGTVGGALRRRMRAALVVAEVALAVAITTGAVLLLRSFVSVTNINPGFETLAAADMADEPAATADEQQRSARVLSRLLRAHGSAAGRGVGRRHHARAARQHVGVDHRADRRTAGTGR